MDTGFRRAVRVAFGAFVVAVACGLVGVASAGAKTVTVGQLFTPTFTTCSGPDTLLQTNVASGTSYVVPKAGVITSWSFDDSVNPVTGLELKVAQAAGSGNYKIVGEATAGTQNADTINTYTTHISVRAGELIGIYEDGGTCGTETTNTLDTYAYASGDVPAGTTAPFLAGTKARFPVSARVSEDCVVPNLKGETLKAAKKALKQASCTLGTVTPKGQTTGTVTQQTPDAGDRLAPGAKVNVRLS